MAIDRRRLDAELAAAVRAARGAAPLPPELEPRLPPAVRETIVAAAELAGDAAAEPLVAYYARRMPALWVEQLVTDDRPAARLLWRPLDGEPLPRLRAALAGLGSSALPVTIAAAYAPTLFGGSAPLLGALAAERAVLDRELAAGADPAALVDLRLAGNLVHELAHGPAVEMDAPPPPWTLLEAAAATLGTWARFEHTFPEVAGEAVAAVAPFALVGLGLARIFGAGFVRGLAGQTGAEIPGALAVAGWQAWLRARSAPFVIHAADGMAWLKLADATRAPGVDLVCRAADGPALALAPRLPPLLEAAARMPWSALPWWAEEPTVADHELLDAAVAALFQVHHMTPAFRTDPAELPAGRFSVDVAAAELIAPPRPDGVFGEPARAPLPPPLARRLAQRGARRIEVEGAARGRRKDVARAIAELALGEQALAEHEVLSWSSSA